MQVMALGASRIAKNSTQGRIDIKKKLLCRDSTGSLTNTIGGQI